MFFSPYQDLGLLGVGKSVPERFSVSMWGRSPIPIEKQFEGSLHIVFSSKVFKTAMLVMVLYPHKIWN